MKCYLHFHTSLCFYLSIELETKVFKYIKLSYFITVYLQSSYISLYMKLHLGPDFFAGYQITLYMFLSKKQEGKSNNNDDIPFTLSVSRFK